MLPFASGGCCQHPARMRRRRPYYGHGRPRTWTSTSTSDATSIGAWAKVWTLFAFCAADCNHCAAHACLGQKKLQAGQCRLVALCCYWMNAGAQHCTHKPNKHTHGTAEVAPQLRPSLEEQARCVERGRCSWRGCCEAAESWERQGGTGSWCSCNGWDASCAGS